MGHEVRIEAQRTDEELGGLAKNHADLTKCRIKSALLERGVEPSNTRATPGVRVNNFEGGTTMHRLGTLIPLQGPEGLHP
jgi:hypothetical protein